ncbi:MAG: TonB family protein [Candidatus Eremiobacteraeota bacterium]|nr:TonB family protein [Candidatus Eremiobacteraeota bacterium]
MNSRRARRLLLAAFGISILVHAIVAVIVHPPRAPVENQVEVVSIRHRVVAVTKLVTPPPQPKRTPVPHPAPSSRPAPRSTHATEAIGTTGGTGRATPAPTPQPAVVASATPASLGCAQPNAGAAVVATPPAPDIPVSVRAQATTGVALVDVQLDAQGAVTEAKVSQSTGNSSLDLVAVGMARNAQYSPAIRACKPTASSYTFSVKFVSW